MQTNQNIGVAFLIDNDNYTSYDAEVIENTVKALFGGYNKLENVYSNGEWQLAYLIQLPVLSNPDIWADFFKKLKKLLELTKEYNSHIFNEP